MRILLNLFMAILLMLQPLPAEAHKEQERFDFTITQITDVNSVLVSLADIVGAKLVTSGEVKGSTMLTLPDTTFEEALDYLAKSCNFNYSIENDTVIVSPSDIYMPNESIRIQHYPLDSDTIKKELSTIVPEDKIFINRENSTVSISGSLSQISAARKKIAVIDQQVPQIRIQAIMLEINRSDAKDLGVSYELPNYDSTIEPWKPAWKATPNLNRIISNGTVLARPLVITYSGREASLTMGDRIPYMEVNNGTDGYRSTNVKYEDVGVFLTTTPFINAEDYVTMNLQPTVSSITGWITNGDTKAPQIAKREAKTIARVKSGQTIVISGLMRTEDVETLVGIPGLMKLPVLGKFFQSKNTQKNKTEVLILVTPTILRDEEPAPAKPAVDPDNVQEIYPIEQPVEQSKEAA